MVEDKIKVDAMFFCPYCGKETSHNIWIYSEEEGNLECGLCGKIFHIYSENVIEFTVSKKGSLEGYSFTK